MTLVQQHVITTTDGVRLAVQEHGDPGLPTIVAVHGYPDDHRVWDGVVALLADRFHVVTYDVRGAGSSERPRRVRDYRNAQLCADFGAVLDAVSPQAPVHLLAHDWGGIQTWDVVTDPAFRTRLLSFTNVSGPSLDMAGTWLRRAHRHPRAAMKQLLDSYYVGLFQLPLLPELAARAGLVRTVAGFSARHRIPAGAPHPAGKTVADTVHGIGLYRANFLGKLSRPKPGTTDVPVQILAPRHDLHVSVPLAIGAPVPYCSDLRTHVIDGNHWVVEHSPGIIADYVVSFIDELAAR